jgi:hypothetical protein
MIVDMIEEKSKIKFKRKFEGYNMYPKGIIMKAPI